MMLFKMWPTLPSEQRISLSGDVTMLYQRLFSAYSQQQILASSAVTVCVAVVGNEIFFALDGNGVAGKRHHLPQRLLLLTEQYHLTALEVSACQPVYQHSVTLSKHWLESLIGYGKDGKGVCTDSQHDYGANSDG